MQPGTAVFGLSPGRAAAMGSTRPVPGDVRLLDAVLHSRRLVLLKALLAHADRHAVPQPVRQRLHADWELLASAEERDPLAARRALAYPSVGTWLVQLLGVREPDALGGLLGGFGALAAAVALRTGIAFRTTLPTREGLLALPGIGVYAVRAPSVRVVAGPRFLRLTPGGRRAGAVLRPPYVRAAGAGWHPLRPLPGAGAAVLDDVDPLRAGGEAGRPQPGTDDAGTDDGGTDDVGRANPRADGPAWARRWQAASALLLAADPARAAETAALVRAVVPLRGVPGAAAQADSRRGMPAGTVSATLRSAPWGVLLRLPETAREAAASLVHEVQHSKLAVLSDVVALHRADATPEHRVPWRSDLRPFDAVLQGTYAHLALADFWHRLATRRGATQAARAAARARCEDYREQVAPALALLRGSGELTPEGAGFTAAMVRRHATLGRCPGPYGGPHTARASPAASVPPDATDVLGHCGPPAQ